MIEKIYVDMDGVLCDFDNSYTKRFNMTPFQMRAKKDSKLFWESWETFIREKHFEKLDWFPGGKELVAFLKSIEDIEIEILSSSGGTKFHDDVSLQKGVWLDRAEIFWERNFVPGRKHKKEYANEHVILIDDTGDVVESFFQNGGNVILHRDAAQTIKLVKEYIRVESVG